MIYDLKDSHLCDLAFRSLRWIRKSIQLGLRQTRALISGLCRCSLVGCILVWSSNLTSDLHTAGSSRLSKRSSVRPQVSNVYKAQDTSRGNAQDPNSDAALPPVSVIGRLIRRPNEHLAPRADCMINYHCNTNNQTPCLRILRSQI